MSTALPPDDNQEKNPFESLDASAGIIENGDAAEAMDEGKPNVAAKAGKAYLVLGVVGVVVLFLLYTAFSGGDKEQETLTEPPVVEVAPKPVEPPPLPVIEEPPPIEAPPPIVAPDIPPPIEVPQIGDVNPLTPKEDAAVQEQIQARMRSNMMVKEGGGPVASSAGGPASAGAAANDQPTDDNSRFAARAMRTKVEQVQATQIGDLRRTIAQGRIIQATLESAINTDLQAPIRAIVSRDTYGEAGTIPLIPKGSRLIGQYNSKVENGQSRVFVIWTRVIRPDGVDVMVGSPLVDQIGQSGVAGQLDSKFQQLFARSLVSSVMNIAMAIGAEKLQGGTTTTTTTPEGGSQTSGDAATTATSNALNRLGSVTDGFIQKFIGVPPTILVDQGTSVNVFVNKDLVFPSEFVGGATIQ
jgi:type IV secretion system protein VirB10